MMKTVGLYPLSFLSYWENSRTHRLFGRDTYCSAPTMGLLSTSEVKVLYWKAALAQWQCDDIKAKCKYLRNLRIFSTFFWKWGRGTFPPPSCTCRPRLGLLLDPRMHHAKFGCSSSYRDWMHKEQTNKQTFFFIYIEDRSYQIEKKGYGSDAQIHYIRMN